MIAHAATTLSMISIIEDHARKRPDRIAVIYNDRRFSYGQLNAMANMIANGLVNLGIKPGDHVALSCPNLPYFPMAYYGIIKAGAVVVTLNVLLKPREIAYHLQDSEAKAFFCFEGTAELPMGQMGKTAFDTAPQCEHLIVITANPASPTSIEGAVTLGQLMHDQPPSFAAHAPQADDTAVILYTSGTTGQPKGAELSHMNLLMNAMVVRDLVATVMKTGADAENVVLITLPLFHATAQQAQMNANLLAGATLTLMPRFEAGSVLEVMKRDKVNFWTGVPTMFHALLHYAAANNIDIAPIAASLRLASSGGAPMPVDVMKQFEEMFGVRIMEGYGLSETAPVASFNHMDKPSKAGTVGQALWGVDIICADDNDRPVPTGERGEVLIRGHNIMKGYYKRPEATAEAMRNGWFHTGDIGILDEEGYLSIVDRKKDMILRGGYSVYPRELEDVMMTHPSVSLVAVVGIPDEKLGEEIKAFVVRKAGMETTEKELVAWCKEEFAAYKYPRHIEFRDHLPTSATGKILKRELRQS
ncbi:long-chain fatty acid--CoA ligase [Nitrosospira sp. NRS527]|uniref:long-chain-fatty-acid--CoA ligase n=1 Tax=Nitrosospira sp. NRS527 TaxID=155925 RepID=UPI001AF9553E|nr:long-chain fatty acid--CoA ligase [Nitrosospira sp. NRS527]BCT68113.1 Long-chain-fatty-acid--CoA ligase [Nitrosospira sp. NRS527]